MVLQQVLSVALVLQIDALSVTVDIAAELEKDVTVDNCTSILACADCHHLPQLKQKGQAVAKRAFVAVASDPVVPASSMLVLLQSEISTSILKSRWLRHSLLGSRGKQSLSLRQNSWKYLASCASCCSRRSS